jgi:hypothetical protein
VCVWARQTREGVTVWRLGTDVYKAKATKVRVHLTDQQRSELLIANQHACCICGDAGVQIHHINGDPSDNRPANLAVLCLHHHDEATSVAGLSAKLTAPQVRAYKGNWERSCLDRVRKAARGRTAFFMVDYKNAERIRQLYDQLTQAEYEQAHEILTKQFQEEEALRKTQGFDISLEPNTSWNEHTRKMLSWVKARTSHPKVFHKAIGHPQDPMLPTGPIWLHQEVPYYDLWCQIMIRAIIAVRDPYDLDDFFKLKDPTTLIPAGGLVSFEGRMKAVLHHPPSGKCAPHPRQS